jgi:type II secretion system protein N
MTFLTSERLRTARAVGWRVGFGLLVFVVAFYFWFPYDRVKEQLVALAAQRDIDVQIASAGPLLGVGIALHDIDVIRKAATGQKSKPLRIDEARVHLAPVRMLFGERAGRISAELLGGDLDLGWQQSKSHSALQIKTEELSLAQIPGVKESINLPIFGKLGLALDLGMAGNKLADTEGTVSWTCAGCAIGDGKSKLKVAGNPMLAEGLSLPRIRFGDLTGRVVFDKGVGRLQAVQAHSPDGELTVEGEIRLADPMPYSQIDLYIRFKFSDTLLKSADKLQIILQLMESMGKRPDGFYGLRLSGMLMRLSPPVWAKTSPFGAGGSGVRPGPVPHLPSSRPGAFGGGLRPSPIPAPPAPPPDDRAAGIIRNPEPPRPLPSPPSEPPPGSTAPPIAMPPGAGDQHRPSGEVPSAAPPPGAPQPPPTPPGAPPPPAEE